MKKILLGVLLIISPWAFSQISVDDGLTAEQLIEDIFINSACVDVFNVQQSTGTNFGESTGIGAFDQNGSDFPFADGIVLSSGYLANVPGPNLALLSDGVFSWPGDADLEGVTAVLETNNASSIQFDFIPFVNQVNLNFIMTSEEYNQNFECTFSDAFAFILTDQVTGEIENLAVIPETDIPIEITRVHPDVPGQCPAINEQYFDKYNFEPFNPAANAAINFNGQMVSIIGKAEVVIGNQYTIKMVIADATDTALDSAVFLEGGSFVYELDLGKDYTLDQGNAVCIGDELTLGVSLASGTVYQWLEFDTVSGLFEMISGATSSEFDVTTSGLYRLDVTNATCSLSDTIAVEFVAQAQAGSAANIFIDEGDNDGLAIFDLTTNDASILGAQNPSDFDIFYFETLVDADANTNSIANPQAYMNVINPQIVFARLQLKEGNCYDITQFEIATDGVLGIDDVPTNTIILYPNPAGDELMISSGNVASTATILMFDLQGKKVLSETNILLEGELRLNVSHLEAGMYFLQIVSEGMILTEKIIKN